MVKKEESPIEDRDQQILRRLTNIEHKIDSLEQTTAFALRADEKRHFESVKVIFGKSRKCVQVYLAANGNRSVQDIADMLGMQQSNVSRELVRLGQEGLIEIIEREGGRSIWAKKPIDRTIRISPWLMKEYQLDQNGLPVEKPPES
jgi:DNA-binding MarR family transcriptional regulator